MLALSDSELEAVMAAAGPLAVQDRSKFLESVAVELAKYPEVGPGTVGRVVRTVQRKFFDPPSFYSGGSKYR